MTQQPEAPKHEHDDKGRPGSPSCHGDDCSVTARPQQTISLNAQAAAEQVTTLRVEGMDCADEVAALERALKPEAGLRDFKVNLMAGKVTFAHEKKLSTADLIRAVGQAGLKARIKSPVESFFSCVKVTLPAIKLTLKSRRPATGLSARSRAATSSAQSMPSTRKVVSCSAAACAFSAMVC